MIIIIMQERVAKEGAENKALSLDSIPNKALKAAVNIAPNMFGEIFTVCFKEGSISYKAAQAQTNSHYQAKQTFG